ncbi:hypothetical protein DPV73_04815 [Leptospira mayottensis]|nr:hypothetical protein DPV73_04815 [Leptospira mayottensis]
MKFLHVFFLTYPKTQNWKPRTTTLSCIVKFSQGSPNPTYCFSDVDRLRQNGAPSGLENRGLDASIYHKTRKPTEGT